MLLVHDWTFSFGLVARSWVLISLDASAGAALVCHLGRWSRANSICVVGVLIPAQSPTVVDASVHDESLRGLHLARLRLSRDLCHHSGVLVVLINVAALVGKRSL